MNYKCNECGSRFSCNVKPICCPVCNSIVVEDDIVSTNSDKSSFKAGDKVSVFIVDSCVGKKFEDLVPDYTGVLKGIKTTGILLETDRSRMLIDYKKIRYLSPL